MREKILHNLTQVSPGVVYVSPSEHGYALPSLTKPGFMIKHPSEPGYTRVHFGAHLKVKSGASGYHLLTHTASYLIGSSSHQAGRERFHAILAVPIGCHIWTSPIALNQLQVNSSARWPHPSEPKYNDHTWVWHNQVQVNSGVNSGAE